MARPEFSAIRSGGSKATKPTNAFSDWWKSRKEHHIQAQEEASRMITNKITENEATLIDQLENIDFSRSSLPKHVLGKKAREKMPYCELEFAVLGLIRKLQGSPQTIKTDIREIDKKLLALVLLMKQAVAQGDTNAAYACRAALLRGINDIRARIPQEQPQLAKQFVELNSKYLDQWITLVSMAQAYDRSEQNVERQRAKLESDTKAHNASVVALHQSLLDDTKLGDAYNYILKHGSAEDRENWSDDHRKAYKVLLEQNIEEIQLRISKQLVHQGEIDLATQKAQINMLETKLTNLEIVQDPNLMNKFNEAMDELTKQMATDDQHINEALMKMEKVAVEIEVMNNAPGSIRVRQMAAEQAKKTLEAIKEYEAEQMGLTEKRRKESLNRLGLHTEEELAAMRKENEAIMATQEAALDQAIAEANEQNNEEETANYN